MFCLFLIVSYSVPSCRITPLTQLWLQYFKIIEQRPHYFHTLKPAPSYFFSFKLVPYIGLSSQLPVPSLRHQCTGFISQLTLLAKRLNCGRKWSTHRKPTESRGSRMFLAGKQTNAGNSTNLFTTSPLLHSKIGSVISVGKISGRIFSQYFSFLPSVLAGLVQLGEIAALFQAEGVWTCSKPRDLCHLYYNHVAFGRSVYLTVISGPLGISET